MAVFLGTLELSLLDPSPMSDFADGLPAKRRVVCLFCDFRHWFPLSQLCTISYTGNCIMSGKGAGLLSPYIIPAPFPLIIKLSVVSYLALSVRLAVKQVRVNKCVVQYYWSTVFKGPIKRCNTLQVRYYQNN